MMPRDDADVQEVGCAQHIALLGGAQGGFVLEDGLGRQRALPLRLGIGGERVVHVLPSLQHRLPERDRRFPLLRFAQPQRARQLPALEQRDGYGGTHLKCTGRQDERVRKPQAVEVSHAGQ